MTRIAVGLEYDGRAYAGWQTQATAPSIQACVEAALTSVAAEPVSLICAGRTDAGVHATGQVAHFDTQAARSARGWLLGANTLLPADVSLTWVQAMPGHFHARYSAEARTYTYVICNRTARPALGAGRVTHVHYALAHEEMAAAGRLLEGEHDFSAFRAVECQARSPVRILESLAVQRRGDLVLIRVTANAFLHHMVRNIAGLLIEIGRGRAPVGWAAEVLAGRDRTRGAPTAPADGLYLTQVRYPAPFGVPRGEASSASAMMPPELTRPA
ncbi:MAG TPA: tRNA pseudouridine(38-40) synthase TruA [Steroidobacteraceae bacterium]|nr:tRNA pseudouridine(38-40) synthase TruA [Steroidobacteraceae bacterium]